MFSLSLRSADVEGTGTGLEVRGLLLGLFDILKMNLIEGTRAVLCRER